MKLIRLIIIGAVSVFFIYLLTASYFNVEYINGKGPDDVGVIFFTEHELTKLIGSRNGKASFKVTEFKKAERNNSGLYKVWFKWNGNEGFLLVDYEPEKPHFISKGFEHQ